MNVYLGGPVEVSDMQGPAPTGFHVPLSTEWQAIYNAGVSLGAWSSNGGTNLSTYLKMPIAGYRDYINLGFNSRGLEGYYWASTPNGADYAYNIYFYSSYIKPQSDTYRSFGFSLRCIKDSPTIPTSSWTVLYQGTGNAGIFHNTTDGLISISSDGTTWYTIMDKNLGATTVYNYGDTMSEANCGKVYQWGNNYGFSGDANYDVSQITQSSTQVNVTGYGPGNYYESSTWIKARPWQSSANNGNNLRGGVTQGTSTKSVEVQNIYIGEYEPNFATQGPCPDGFHVPLMSEWTGLYTIMSGLGLTTGNDLKTNLHLPFAGFRDYSNSNVSYQDSYGEYWSSTNDTTYIYAAKYLLIYSSATETNNRLIHSYGISIRPFKDSFVVPTSSWTVIQGTIGGAGIFRNQTDGIISITSDGTTGYTIADKNLGATTVYNNGDTLSEANCGKYYQWGNNYGFSRTGSVTTSSTQVNAQNYGPGNYYSSSTFIIGNNNWDSSNNANLRGGVDGNVPVE